MIEEIVIELITRVDLRGVRGNKDSRAEIDLIGIIAGLILIMEDKPGLMHILYYDIDTDDKPSVVSRPYWYDKVKQGILDYNVDHMLKEGHVDSGEKVSPTEGIPQLSGGAIGAHDLHSHCNPNNFHILLTSRIIKTSVSLSALLVVFHFGWQTFERGKIIGHQEGGFSYHQIGARVQRNSSEGMRVWKHWTDKHQTTKKLAVDEGKVHQGDDRHLLLMGVNELPPCSWKHVGLLLQVY
ncbi:hypothetical protein TNCV_869061 [Trichonephila clavipes]|nr:hypothetical protein TNCV_869061 [Trichonephila clavipes]